MRKAYNNGKLDVVNTIKLNTPSARVPKHKRESLKQIIERRKNAARNARLVNLF